jgi:formylglycine-generating enzyme required for sulfatase activity
MLIKADKYETHTFNLTLENGKNYVYPMVLIEAGEYQMGGESGYEDSLPTHSVKLSKYYIGQYLVTQELWLAVMGGENPSSFQGNNHPVEQVSWNDCQNFIQKINQLTIKGLNGKPILGGAFRLPTEAEWEYAARGGKDWEKKYEYAGSNDLAQVAWNDENSFRQTMPVGLKLPNQLGIYDLSGNVWEWCEDHYDSEFYEQCAAQGIVSNPFCRTDSTTSRVLRGGGYFDGAGLCRVSFRFINDAEFRNFDLGFRVGFSFQLHQGGIQTGF